MGWGRHYSEDEKSPISIRIVPNPNLSHILFLAYLPISEVLFFELIYRVLTLHVDTLRGRVNLWLRLR